MHQAKRKSAKRFEQMNVLVDQVAPKLPTPAHTAVMLCCFRHGNPGGYFRASTERLAKSVGLKKRRIQDILDELEGMGVIRIVKEHQGPIPRVYRFGFLLVNGALQCTVKPTSPPI